MSVSDDLVLSPVTGQGEEDLNVVGVAELHETVAEIVEKGEELVTENPRVAESNICHLNVKFIINYSLLLEMHAQLIYYIKEVI